MNHAVWLYGLIAACLVLLAVDRKGPELLLKVRQYVTDLSAPVLETASGPIEDMRRVGSRIGSYQYLYGEVGRLRKENESLHVWRAKAIEMESRLKRFEELLNVRREPALKFVTARVIADARGPFVRTVIVNVGRTQGVRAHQAVMDARGLIGRTVTAGEEASRVLLLSDLNSRIPVRIEPHGYRAILTGTNRPTPRLDFLPDHVSIKEGDVVFTSGDGGELPPGLPIGVVAAASGGRFTVAPYANPRRLSHVRVFEYQPSLAVDVQAAEEGDPDETK
ncbi:MAG: rod shape-determining protein MreC, partial [Hyphomicrobiales bacterium]